MHIFLTGPLQSGKSTAIARYLVGRPEAPGGFRTHWDRAGGRLKIQSEQCHKGGHKQPADHILEIRPEFSF